jgi:hypothetical protein
MGGVENCVVHRWHMPWHVSLTRRGGALLGALLDHLACCDHGARLRVSTNNFPAGHHPIFLIDGRIGVLASLAGC